MNGLVLGASLAAILALIGIVWSLRRRRTARAIDEPAAAMQIADAAIASFVPQTAAVATDGRTALVVGEGLRVVVLKAHGARIAAREIAWTDVRSTPSGIVVETRARRFGCVRLIGVNVLDVRRLAPQLTAA